MNLKNCPQLFVGVFFVVLFTNCKPSGQEWEAKNRELIKQYGLSEKEIEGLPKETVPPNLDAAKVKNLEAFEQTEWHPGVKGRTVWGKGAMFAILELNPGAMIPEELLEEERFVLLVEGSLDLKVNGASMKMTSRKREAQDGTHSGTPRMDFIYLEKGTKLSITAGSEGAKICQVFSPPQLEYIRKTGIKDLTKEIEKYQGLNSPNIEANKVYDLFDIHLTELAPGAFTRVLGGSNMMLSFISMPPNSSFGHHIHQEEQIMAILRGTVNEILLDNSELMETLDVVRIPGNYVHAANIGALGAEALDIFWPSRSDYLAKANESKARFHEFIPEDAKLELLIDGKKTKPELFFTEGPKWMNGKLYFSNMYFDQDWNGDPKQSSIVEMLPDGSYRNITQGKMQANGLYPYKNNNLLVCDMMGHKVVEMTSLGQIIRVLVDQYDGKPIDGPNDIITDTKGGFYFTDPQFTMEAEKFQPGRAVYYVSPQGEIKRITEPNEFAMPNGILLSPDGKTLYINNCFDKESWYPVQSEKENFIWAYDVQEDGSISNGRQFAQVLLTEDVLNREGRSSGADGMAIDKEGNIYVATFYGVQIFDNTGKFVGMINLPSFPVSLCFGDDDMKTLYIVSYSKVFKIRTNKEGYINYL
ncbi:SMP-30/gluconolactonase/LRE family protein [Shivajiella indica]|uniref:SMP-30/gluconolactonase/LRE family protein n=1 Tax=Shivajiella indica TaxID=872115 RepID=A0ABW5B4K5_9BACT